MPKYVFDVPTSPDFAAESGRPLRRDITLPTWSRVEVEAETFAEARRAAEDAVVVPGRMIHGYAKLRADSSD